MQITTDRIHELKRQLADGSILPNHDENFVFKVICGAGKHSKGGVAVLKKEVRSLMEDLKARGVIDDFYSQYEHGNYLVRIKTS